MDCTQHTHAGAHQWACEPVCLAQQAQGTHHIAGQPVLVLQAGTARPGSVVGGDISWAQLDSGDMNTHAAWQECAHPNPVLPCLPTATQHDMKRQTARTNSHSPPKSSDQLHTPHLGGFHAQLQHRQ